MNLLLNAIHACKNGGKIIIKTYSDAEQVTASITDNGRGIRPEKLETHLNQDLQKRTQEFKCVQGSTRAAILFTTIMVLLK